MSQHRCDQTKAKIPTLVALSVLLIHCSDSSFKSKAQPLLSFKTSCPLTGNPETSWSWCNQNIVTGSSIHEVCLGFTPSQGSQRIILRFSQHQGSALDDCWIGSNESQSLPVQVGCETIESRSYQRFPGSTQANSSPAEIIECYQSNQVVRVSGSLNEIRTEFVALIPPTKFLSGEK